MSNIDLSAYQGLWVALFQDQVVGVGESPSDALALARRNRSKDRFRLQFVEKAGGTPLIIPPLLDQLRPFFLQQEQPVYLVGGAVRDMLLNRPCHDLDFAVPYDGVRLSLKVGDAFGWPAYALDKERDIGRVVLVEQNASLDFAKFRGATIEEDLVGRDFTINALALPATAQFRESIIDPTGGLSDLEQQKINLVKWDSPSSLDRDPIRALRAVRFSLLLNNALDQRWRPKLEKISFQTISPERIRDAFLKLLDSPNPVRAISQLRSFGLWRKISVQLDNIFALRCQDRAHQQVDIAAYTLDLLAQLGAVEQWSHQSGSLNEPALEPLLAPFQPLIKQRLAREVAGQMNGRLLMRLAALFQWAGHLIIEGESEPCQPPGYEEAGAHLAAQWLREFSFSNQAIAFITQLIRHQNRLLTLVEKHRPEEIDRRLAFRYFRDTQDVGVEVGIFSLASHLAHHKADMSPKLGQIVSTLLTVYEQLYDEVINPALLLNGRDLMQLLNLRSGPEIGRLLALLKEEQAAGAVQTKSEAIELMRQAAA